VVVDAKAIMQIAEPMIESDFISVASVYSMRGLPTLGLYADRYRMQIKSGRCCWNKLPRSRREPKRAGAGSA
jgi:hypothetical protein